MYLDINETLEDSKKKNFTVCDLELTQQFTFPVRV